MSAGEIPGRSRQRTSWAFSFRLALVLRPGDRPPRYAELHCHSNFSFLDGASHPEELAEEAARLGLEALALTDHDGFYGVVRFAEAARAVGLPTVFGAELTLGARPSPQNGDADPRGRPPARAGARPGRATPGWRGRSARAQLARRREGPAAVYTARRARRRPHGGHWLVLTGCRKGAVARARSSDRRARRPRAARARRAGRRVRARQRARSSCGTTATRSTRPATTPSRSSAPTAGVDVVATNNVHYATPAATPPGHRARRGAGAAQPRRARRVAAGGGRRAPALGRRAGPPLRPLPRRGRAAPPSSGASAPSTCAGRARTCRRSRAPTGSTRWATCARLADGGRTAPLRRRASAERVPGRVRRRSTTSSTLIEQLGFPGYFLVVWDIVEFCRRNDIFCQGRGSAANSAVCYALGITNADAVTPRPALRAVPLARARRPARHRHRHRVGPARGGHPVRLRAHGREHAAQVANVITYRAAVGGPRHGQGARLRAGPAGRLVEAGRPLGPAPPSTPRQQADQATIPDDGARAGRARSSTSRATSASTRAAW